MGLGLRLGLRVSSLLGAPAAAAGVKSVALCTVRMRGQLPSAAGVCMKLSPVSSYLVRGGGWG